MSNLISVIAASIASFAAFVSVWFAFRTRQENKADEKLIVSKLNHPDLRHREHSQRVLWCTLFNKSKRKVDVRNVFAYDNKNTSISITWSKQINEIGNPQNPCDLIGITDSENLFIYRNDGAIFDFCKLEIHHSFPSSPIRLTFDEYADGWKL